MGAIKAIETEYAGHLFRSRLEARWAVFFDTLGIKWLYEPQGYVVSGQPYLPDFWIGGNGLALWVEVKGELDKAGLAKLGDAAGSAGLPFRPWDNMRPCDLDFGDRSWVDLATPGLDRILVLGEIPNPTTEWVHPLLKLINGRHVVEQQCGWWGMRGGGYRPLPMDTWFPLGASPSPHMPHGGPFPPLRLHSKVADAYRAARSARFEHGENGAML